MLTIKWVASAKMYLVNYNGFKRWFNMRDFEQLHTIAQLKKEMGEGLC